MQTQLPARALTIAGSDNSGGAGIQADLKTFTAYRTYGMSVITAVTAQNTLGVKSFVTMSPEFVVEQLDTIWTDIGVDAVKTGMLASPEIIEALATYLKDHPIAHLVIDPVMIAKSGDPLLAPEANRALKEMLLPLASVITPNLPEASALLGRPVETREDQKEAARMLHDLGPDWVVVKGGHLADDAIDIAFNGTEFYELRSERIRTRNTHGTGCTFSAAITAGLALGRSVPEALHDAKAFITEAIRQSFSIGQGHGPTNHLIENWKPA